jgi:hypothetical protein
MLVEHPGLFLKKKKFGARLMGLKDFESIVGTFVPIKYYTINIEFGVGVPAGCRRLFRQPASCQPNNAKTTPKQR